MNARETVRNWLREIPKDVEREPLDLDQRGVGTFDYDDLRVIIEGSAVFHAYSPVAAAPSGGREAFYERLLSLNFLHLETRGTTFALRPDTHEVVLCYTAPVDSLDALGFANTLGNFLETAARADRLGSAGAGTEAGPPVEEPGTVLKDFRMRV